ncbi:hypothetical protein ACH4TV_40825 [Streptomyces sp. NPDC020898]|uniref:hypothetical protein n=1 Tax=Streptomyces sp. NPDC020898 TaxID=3365101 RepID=UPI0037B7B18F
MIRRLGRYVGVAYPPRTQLPLMLSWAVGLTALFACTVGTVSRWRPDGGLAITAVTLVVDMLLLRALDDLRDHGYDREHHPSRPLPSGMVTQRDLLTLVAVGTAVLLLLNAHRGMVLAALGVQLAYGIGVMTLEWRTGRPSADRLGLQLALNLPIQTLLSLYVYAGFLRAEQQQPNLAGLMAVAAATFGGLCLELGRKTTRRPRPGERTYVTVLGPALTSAAAVAAAATATAIVLAITQPWRPEAAGYGWGWLLLIPLLLPATAAARFAAGATGWPVALTRNYLPAMYASFLAVGLLTEGGLR